MWYETFSTTTLSMKYDEETEAQAGKVKGPCLPSLWEAEVGIELRSPDPTCPPCQAGCLVFTEMLAMVSGVKKVLSGWGRGPGAEYLSSARLDKEGGLWPTRLRA